MSDLEAGPHYPLHLDVLPNNWTATDIGDAIPDVQSGFPSGKHNKKGNGVAHLRPMNINRSGQLDLSDLKFVPEDADDLRIKVGDVLFNNTNSPELIGKTTSISVPGEWAFSNHMTRLRPPEGLDPRFVAHQLHYLWMAGYFRHRCTHHVNQASIASTTLANSVPLVVAPSSEQDRIVAEIEKQFTRLDDAVAALKRVQTNLKRYRASVLKAACEGRLVPTEAELAHKEGRDYEPASELLKRVLAERRAKWEADQLQKMIAAGKRHKNDDWKKAYKPPVAQDPSSLPDLPEGWIWASLDEITIEALIGLDRGRENQRDEPVGSPYVKMNNVSLQGEVDFTNLVYIDATKAELAKFGIQDGDLLFNTRNSVELVGKVGVVLSPPAGAVYNNNLMRIRLSSGINPHFMCAQMTAVAFRKQMELVKRATTNVAAVYAKDLFPLAVAVPPLNEQSRIAEAVEKQTSMLRRLVIDCDGLKHRSNGLRHATLRQAFSGKLVPQDPNDEPASVLLERLRAERASQQTTREKGPLSSNGASRVAGQRRRRGARLAQPVRAGKA